MDYVFSSAILVIYYNQELLEILVVIKDVSENMFSCKSELQTDATSGQ